MEEQFVKLREFLTRPLGDSSWRYDLCRLLKEAYDEDEEVYRDVWIPYCSGHRDVFQIPMRSVSNATELASWVNVMPFALFELCLADTPTDMKEYQDFATSHLLQHIGRLYFGNQKIEFELNLPLLGSAYLTNLKVLCVEFTEFGDKECEYIAGCENLRSLVEIEANDNHIRDEGVRALVRSPYLQQLRVLKLDWNLISNKGCEYIAASHGLKHLVKLDLHANSIDCNGLIALSSSMLLSQLREFYIGDNRIGLEGLRALMNSPYLQELRCLGLSSNEFGDEGCELIANNERLRGLQWLDIFGCDIGDEGCAAIVQSPHLGNVQELNMAENLIGDEGCCAIGNATALQQLRTLDFWGNEDVSSDGYMAILCSVTLPIEIRLSFLDSVSLEELQEKAALYGIEAKEGMDQKMLVELIWGAKEAA